MYKILVINPGSTSTKIAIFEDEEGVALKTLRHSVEELKLFPKVIDQIDFRKSMIISFLNEHRYELSDFNAVVGVGGLLKPLTSGVYIVNQIMLEDLKKGIQGEHPSNLGGILAHLFATKVNIPAFIVDPVVVDELNEVARISGMPEIKRRSIFHALNQKAVARRGADFLGKEYDEVNLVVVHMGGGISIGAHCKGKVIDVNNAYNGDGPLTPERSGGLPAGDLVNLCFSNKFTQEEILKKITGRGGLVAYLGTNSAQEVEERIKKGDEFAKLIYDAMIYQTTKEIGAMATTMKGQVDAIVISGGLARSSYIINKIKEYVSFIAPVLIYPGEDEMKALADGALRVLRGIEAPKEYI